jgi:dihydrofolate reductase
MKLIIIAAHSLNLVIGSGGKIPWNLPGDVRRFKRLTMGHTVLMGRKTYESIGRPLPGRRCVVLTSHPLPGEETYRSLREALDALKDEKIVFVIGGERLFRETLPLAEELYMTVLRRTVEGDVFFPEYAALVSEKFHLVDSESGNEADYRHYRRISS